MAEDEFLTGTVEDIIYSNSENGYTVFSIENEDDEVVCVGTVPDIHTGESVKLTGSWTMHSTYGLQFQVLYYEKTMPESVEGIEKYLSSGIISGIGKKTAKRIVERFGEASFYVIEEKPERLVEIRGITYEKAMRISEMFIQQNELRKTMMFLQQFGVTPAYAMRIFKKYKDKTVTIVQNNPYKLADDIFGIGFKMADKIAASTGFSPDSPERIKAGVKYILNQAAGDGHVYLPSDELISKTSEILGVEGAVVENVLIELQIDHQIWQDKTDNGSRIYLNIFYYAEVSVAKKLLELYCDKGTYSNEYYEGLIEKAEEKTGIELADMQKKAVLEALNQGVLVITGGPGTGKTTIINTIITLLEDDGKKIVLAAPTGRAAKRMTEATGHDAQTIHRILGITYVNDDSRHQTFDKNEDDPIDADVIIIDESSMVDILLMSNLLKAIKAGTKLILVGDVDQLPSVGAGNVLKDIIQSGVIEVVRLTEVFRQARESAIIMNAHRINSGQMPVLNEKDKDFFLVRRSNSVEALKTVKELITKRLPAFSGCDPFNDMQVLTPMRKGQLGVYELNKYLQETLNPPEKGKPEKAFKNFILRQGDKVMQIKNNYNIEWKLYENNRQTDAGLGVFNGDCGIIEKIDNDDETITVLFDDGKKVVYDFIQLDEIELAYAVTIHKSQGSEYPVVIIPLISGPPMLLSRNLLYTAVTRARTLAVIVGLSDTIRRMVDNNREINRYSTLDLRIKNIYDFINQ
ncbi:ATP-dependent RecD-like DNA helicase [Lachnospiraceae bacterium NSJ-143]|nr:ATP-dependent RecD-like DNA helicase [Lachnospiraceae bacterium NSJ-143]